MKYILMALLITLFFGCTSKNKSIQISKQQPADELLDFAKTNCFFWYFKKKGYDIEDIRAISGGIVETGSYSASIYQQISLMVKDYSPTIVTKQNIDTDLLKCFKLDRDPEFIRSIKQLG